jgi:DNA mismatch endonuclease (patch repair protein)
MSHCRPYSVGDVPSTATKPELALRRALHKLGYRFRKDYRLDLHGGTRVRPDIAFTARRVAVFVDGCFWHACPQHGSKPRANDWYWTPKLARNVERDRVADQTLAAAGWQVVRIWEHESLEQALAAVIAVVEARPAVDPVAPAVDPVAPPVDPVAPDDVPVAADGLRASRSADKI